MDERHRRLGVVGEVLDIVGDAEHRGVAGSDGADTPTPVWLARLRNEETKLPDWLAIAIFRRANGATIWAHMLEGVDTTP